MNILKLHVSPFLQLCKGFVETFLRRLLFSDVKRVVDDSERIHQVGAEKRIYIFWEEFPPASSVLGPVGEVTDHFGRGCCNRNMSVMNIGFEQKTMAEISLLYKYNVWLEKNITHPCESEAAEQLREARNHLLMQKHSLKLNTSLNK